MEKNTTASLLSRRSLARLGAELVVVFLGVYGAFLAESLRESRDNDQAARSIYLALADEIEDHVTIGQVVLDRYIDAQRAWDESYAAGRMPAPWAIPWSADAAGPPVSAWPATLASGGVRLMNQEFFYRLAKYYRSVDAFLIPVDAPDPFAENEILAHRDGDSSQFYDGPDLRPRFRQYLERRRAILQGARETLDEGRDLLVALQSAAGL